MSHNSPFPLEDSTDSPAHAPMRMPGAFSLLSRWQVRAEVQAYIRRPKVFPATSRRRHSASYTRADPRLLFREYYLSRLTTSYLPIASPAEICTLPSSPTASCCRLRSFARKSCVHSSSSGPRRGFLRSDCHAGSTVGCKRRCPSAALSRNILRVGECASCSPAWRSRASD